MTQRIELKASTSIFILLGLLMMGNTVFAQKIELEESIKKEEFPKNILEMFDENFLENSHPNYYREKNEDGIFYEIKLKHRGNKWSIKFTNEGKIYDAEKLINLKKTPVYKKIKKDIKEKYGKFYIIKSQIQFLPDDAEDLNELLNLEEKDEKEDDEQEEYEIEDDDDYKYEIEIESQMLKKGGYYEILCSSTGEILKERKIIMRSQDNVMY